MFAITLLQKLNIVQLIKEKRLFVSLLSFVVGCNITVCTTLFAQENYDADVIKEFQKYVFDENYTGKVRKLPEILHGQIFINIYESNYDNDKKIREKLLEVTNNILIDQLKFKIYKEYKDRRIIINSHIAIAYGKREFLMSTDLYRAIAALDGEQAVIDLGNGIFNGKFDDINYKNTQEFNFICSGLNFSFYDRYVNTFAIVLVEEADLDIECIYRQVFHFVGFRGIRDYYKNPSDLTRVYRLLRERTVRPGMSAEEFDKISSSFLE